MLDADLKAEYAARGLYKEAREVCDEEGDYVSMALFDRLLADEEGHIDFLETQIDLFDRIGEQNFGAPNSQPNDALE